MKDTYFVIFNRQGIDRWTKTGKIQLKQGSLAQQVDFEVDDALFQPVRVPRVAIHVNAAGVARVVESEVEEGDA